IRKARTDIRSYVTPSTLSMIKKARTGIQSYVTPSTLSMIRKARTDIQSIITPDILNTIAAISELDINELELYWEDDEVQETIKQELSALESVENQEKLIDRLNNWVKMLIGLPNDLLEKSPKALVTVLILIWISDLVIKPAVEDIIKEKVLHLSAYLEEKPEEPVRKKTKTFKKRVITDHEVAAEINYADAERSMRHVRITNRKTDVFRSEQRKSGKLDIIQTNKPVIILHKKKNWSLVLYRDSNNQEVEGWVFTKNLTK
ncbi:hypothetical protein ABEX08_11595, partial [Priestia megaterium]